MTKVKRDCGWCGNKFDAPIAEVNRGNARFCSMKCGRNSCKEKLVEENKLRAANGRVGLVCKQCGCAYRAKLCLSKKSKFCSKKCMDKARTIHGESNARKVARKILPNECYHCKTKRNLILHHKDHNHYNNNPKNWRMVCRSCHNKIEHWSAIKKHFSKTWERRRAGQRVNLGL